MQHSTEWLGNPGGKVRQQPPPCGARAISREKVAGGWTGETRYVRTSTRARGARSREGNTNIPLTTPTSTFVVCRAYSEKTKEV